MEASVLYWTMAEQCSVVRFLKVEEGVKQIEINRGMVIFTVCQLKNKTKKKQKNNKKHQI